VSQLARDFFTRRQQIDDQIAAVWFGVPNPPASVMVRQEQQHLPTPIRPQPLHIHSGQTAVHQEPHTRMVGMKIVRVSITIGWGGKTRFFSTFDNTEYTIGQRKYQEARANHGGGYFVYRGDVAETTRLFHERKIINRDFHTRYGLLACEVEPPFVAYDWEGGMIVGCAEAQNIKKVAVSGITPLEYLGCI